MNEFTSNAGITIASISLYSTGHWIGGTVCLVILALSAWEYK